VVEAGIKRRRPAIGALTLALIAGAAFWSLHVAHFLWAPPGQTPTGFIEYDQLYYLAEAQEMVAEGRWLFYRNPFDDHQAARAIYIQLEKSLWGLALRAGITPEHAYLLFLFVGGLATALIFRALVHQVLSGGQPFFRTIFLLGMWGGGLLVPAGLATTLWHGERVTWPAVIRFDPMEGWWFLNLGRNLVFATEAYYHALALGALLLALRRRWVPALLCVATLVASTPFTGVQFALTFTLWSFLERILGGPSRPPTWFVLGSIALLALHLGYYIVLLPLDPRHAAIYGGLKLDWRLPATTIPLAYGLVALLACLQLLPRFRDARLDGSTTRLLLCLLAVSFGLANHELFMPPHQPIHFTRGYVWLPLFLLGAPALNRLLENGFHQENRRLRLATVAATAVCGLLLVDNAAWIGNGLHLARRGALGIYISAPARTLFADLRQAGIRGLALLPEPIDYPAALYTRLTPYTGHWLLTPDWLRRARERNRFYSYGDTAVLTNPAISIVVVPPAYRVVQALRAPQWTTLVATADYLVLARRKDATGSEDPPAKH